MSGVTTTIEKAAKKGGAILVAVCAAVAAWSTMTRTVVASVRIAVPTTQASSPFTARAAARDEILRRAAAEVEAGRRDEAKRLLSDAARKFDSVLALLQLARLQSGDGDGPGALSTLDRARSLAPNAEEVLSAIAQVGLASKAPVAALQALEPLARLYPNVAQHHYLMGVALMQAGDMLAAIDPLREAERLEPSRPLTLVALGIALNNRKMFADAKSVLQRALDREPDNIEGLAAYSESVEGLAELDVAESYTRRVLERAPDHPTANLVAGMVEMKRGRYAEARVALERAAAADPESPKPDYQLSLACARLGDREASARYLASYREKLRAFEERLAALRIGEVPGSGGVKR